MVNSIIITFRVYMQYYNNFSYCVWLILMNMQYYNNFSYCVWLILLNMQYYNTFRVYNAVL